MKGKIDDVPIENHILYDFHDSFELLEFFLRRSIAPQRRQFVQHDLDMLEKSES